jgi:hypothetical protein
MTARVTRKAIWLRIFCAALLLSLGFAHKPLFANPSADPASSYYLLPDGTFASLCIDNADHGKPTKHWLGGGCDACRLTSSLLLPTPSAGRASEKRGGADIKFAVRTEPLGGQIARPGSPVRGPPSFFV